MDARLERVRRVVAMGRRVADARDSMGIEVRSKLLAEGALSPEGVELALSRHLEIDPRPEDLQALVARASSSPRCHVVLSAHVCTAALRAIAIGVATAPRVIVKPSRRDPSLAVALCRELANDAEFRASGGSIAIVEAIAPEPLEEVHAYGSDEALAAIAASLPHGVIVRGHGAGFGLAVIDHGAALDEAAAALAEDVIPFDQQGCLSPRVALIEGTEDRARAFAGALAIALERAGTRVPRGAIEPEGRAAIARYTSLVEALGEARSGASFVVGLDVEPASLVLPPPHRVVHVAPVRDGDHARALLAPWARYVTVIGGQGAVARAIAAQIRGARITQLGAMQRPPLDGPVDQRGVA